MRRGPIWLAGAILGFLFVLLLAGCGSNTPDTEGQTLAQARQTLNEAGVPAGNITVIGESGDEDDFIVCDHDPDGVDPSQPLTLNVAQDCPDDSDRKRKKKKKPGGSRRR